MAVSSSASTAASSALLGCERFEHAVRVKPGSLATPAEQRQYCIVGFSQSYSTGGIPAYSGIGLVKLGLQSIHLGGELRNRACIRREEEAALCNTGFPPTRRDAGSGLWLQHMFSPLFLSSFEPQPWHATQNRAREVELENSTTCALQSTKDDEQTKRQPSEETRRAAPTIET